MSIFLLLLFVGLEFATLNFQHIWITRILMWITRIYCTTIKEKAERDNKFYGKPENVTCRPFVAISGVFNHVALDSTLSDYHQFVDCPTSKDRMIDLLYAIAYSATPSPH